jgi:hypothetical protein
VIEELFETVEVEAVSNILFIDLAEELMIL